MNTYAKVWRWLVWSSADPQKLSLTLKAGAGTILALLLWFGFDLKIDSDSFVEAISATIVSFVGIVNAALTLYGAVRKIYYSFA